MIDVRVQCACGQRYECTGVPFRPRGVGADLVVYYPKENCPRCAGSEAAKYVGRTGFWIPPEGSKLEVMPTQGLRVCDEVIE